MRWTGGASGVLVLFASLAPAPALACGDKFLVIGRGAGRVQKARHPAAIVLYVPVASAFSTTARKMRLEKTLKQAGHKVQSIDDWTALRERMAARRFDFVVTDLGDASSIAAAATANGGQVVPVVAKDADKGAFATYPAVIRAGKSLAYLGTLDAAMAGRAVASAR